MNRDLSQYITIHCIRGRRSFRLEQTASPTPDKIDAYLADLKDRVASTTMHDSIATLWFVAQIIAPGGDFR